MFAKIKKTQRAYKTVSYNEQKVTEKKAACLLAENFVQRPEDLTLYDKLDRVSQLASLNKHVIKPTAHIFLNFDRTDQLSNDDSKDLAVRYLNAAGYGNQPYLVYRHFDAWHPHLHIVSSNVRSTGKVIAHNPMDLHKLYLLTKELEQQFSLKSNQKVSQEEAKLLQVTSAQQVVYGESSLKQAISNVLNTVIDHYKFTTPDELNAVLREYNVRADGGREGTRLYQNRGLVYVALDGNGQQISRGLNASSFSLKPTLPYLEQKFALNRGLREVSRQRVETAIEWTLLSKKPDWNGFQQALGQKGINVVILEDKDGKPGNLFFVDHRELASFSGESLGAQFSLKAIQERCTQQQHLQQEETQRHHLRHHL